MSFAWVRVHRRGVLSNSTGIGCEPLELRRIITASVLQRWQEGGVNAGVFLASVCCFFRIREGRARQGKEEQVIHWCPAER